MFIRVIDWRYSQSCWYFLPSFELFNSPPPPCPVSKYSKVCDWEGMEGFESCGDNILQEFKGSLTRDFRLEVFFMISVPRAHEYSLGAVSNYFENSRRYSRMTVYHRSTTPAISCSPVQQHWRLVLVTNFQWSPVTTTPAINLLQVTTTSVIRVCGVSMDASYHGSSNETIGGRVRLRRPCPTSAARDSRFGLKYFWRPQGL